MKPAKERVQKYIDKSKKLGLEINESEINFLVSFVSNVIKEEINIFKQNEKRK